MNIRLPQQIEINVIGLWAIAHFSYGLITHYHWCLGVNKLLKEKPFYSFDPVFGWLSFILRMTVGLEAKTIQSLCFVVYSVLNSIVFLRKSKLERKFQWHYSPTYSCRLNNRSSVAISEAVDKIPVVAFTLILTTAMLVLGWALLSNYRNNQGGFRSYTPNETVMEFRQKKETK